MKVGAEHPEFGKLCEVLQDIPRKGDVMALKEAIDPGNFLPRCNIPIIWRDYTKYYVYIEKV